MDATTDILDLWVNLVTEQLADDFVRQEGYEGVPGYLGSGGPVGVESLLATMDDLGVATMRAVVCAEIKSFLPLSMLVTQALSSKYRRKLESSFRADWSAWQAARVEVAQATPAAEQAAHPVEKKVVGKIIEKTEISQAPPDQPN